jgi:DNA-binding CsgD family transcriptional regulator
VGRGAGDDMSLVGREAERAEIGRLVETARSGLSGVVAVRGEAGIGKTSLVDAVASSVPDFEVVRLLGIESEMRLGFAALHQLLTPFLDGLEELPPPQARALSAAFGISDDGAPDQFLVGLATLTLLTTAATRRPLLVIVDDTQWLDAESADALGFVARRLHADRVCLLISMRPSLEDRRPFDGLPSITLDPLGEAESNAVLDSSVRGPIAGHIRAHLLAEARGNPLALIEFGRELSADQLAGAAHLPQPLAVDRKLEFHFLRQVQSLPTATQRLLLAAAAAPPGDSGAIWRAGVTLDFDASAIEPAQASGLVELGPELVFRHPLIRSAVYQGASYVDRGRAHEALAAASAGRDVDRGAWHRAAAARFPDEDLAAELEAVARRAGSRGSRAASAAMLARAAELTPDSQRRAVRFLAAAGADLAAGSSTRAMANLALATPDLDNPILAAQARQLEATVSFMDSLPMMLPGTDARPAVEAIVPIMLEATRAMALLDVSLARNAILDTIPMAIYVGDSDRVSVVEVAEVARSLELPKGATPTTADLLLDALAKLIAEGYTSASSLLHEALRVARSDPDLGRDPRHLTKACWVALALSDDDALNDLATECVTLSRERGDFRFLPEALDYQAERELRVGSLNAAEGLFTETIEMHVVLRRLGGPAQAGRLIVMAWRGREAEVRTQAAELRAVAGHLGLVTRMIDHALIVLELGLGNYQAAAALALDEWNVDMGFGGLRAADQVEARARCGDATQARSALSYLVDRAAANGSSLDRGLAARAQALLTSGPDVEPHYLESIARLEESGAVLQLARTQLLYGEWLRRQKRRRDARTELQAARDAFESMGAGGFAERARVELLATGAQARRRVDETRHDLTPQEWQIARLAAGGSTNPEIAERLFISANTVDYHLRKVYRKLEIASRHEIERVLSID